MPSLQWSNFRLWISSTILGVCDAFLGPAAEVLLPLVSSFVVGLAATLYFKLPAGAATGTATFLTWTAIKAARHRRASSADALVQRVLGYMDRFEKLDEKVDTLSARGTSDALVLALRERLEVTLICARHIRTMAKVEVLDSSLEATLVNRCRVFLTSKHHALWCGPASEQLWKSASLEELCVLVQNHIEHERTTQVLGALVSAEFKRQLGDAWPEPVPDPATVDH